jgi:hypothetical protein
LIKFDSKIFELSATFIINFIHSNLFGIVYIQNNVLNNRLYMLSHVYMKSHISFENQLSNSNRKKSNFFLKEILMKHGL